MLLLAVLLALVNDTSGSRNGRWRKRRLRGSHRAVPDDYSALELDGCGRVFLDGGSNTGPNSGCKSRRIPGSNSNSSTYAIAHRGSIRSADSPASYLRLGGN